MATLSERLAFILSLDADGAIRGFNEVGRAADRELGKVEDSLDRIATRSLKMGTGMLGAAAVAGTALFKLSGDASDLGEAMSKTGVLFEEAADGAVAFADSAASIGLSKRAALDALGTFKLFADQAGYANARGLEFSETMVQLASDAASFHNAAPEEVVTALGAAFRGEYEPARRFGVILDTNRVKAIAVNEGLIAQGEALTDTARVSATYKALLEQMAVVQGDFARTSDGAANSARIMEANLENLRASIGSAVTPVVAEGAQIISGFAEDIVGLNDSLGGGLGNLALYATGATAAVGATLVLAGGMLKLQAAVSSASASILVAHPYVTALAAAATVATAVYVQFNRQQQQAKERAEALNPLLGASADGFEQLAGEILASEDIWQKSLGVMDRIGLTFGDVIPVIETGTDVFNDLNEAALGDVRVLERLVDQYRETDPAAAALGDQLLRLLASGELTRQEFRDITDSLGESADSFDDATEAESRNARLIILAAQATGSMTDELIDQHLAQLDNVSSLRELLPVVQSWDAAVSAAESTQARSREVVDLTSLSLDQNAEAIRRARDAEEARTTAIRDGISATLEAASAELGYEGAVDRTEDALRRLEEAQTAAAESNTPENIEAVDDATRDVNRAILEQIGAFQRLNEEATPDELAAELESIGALVGDQGPVQERIQSLQDKLLEVDESNVEPSVTLNTRDIDRELDRLEGRLNRLGSTTITVPLVLSGVEGELD